MTQAKGHRQPPAPSSLSTGRAGLLLVTAALGALIAVAGIAGAADPVNETEKLIADDGGTGANFGSGAVLDGDTAIVGARLADTAQGSETGAAYVYTRENGTWTQQAKLTASDGEGQDYFGASVALEGDTALVGAYLDDNANGEDAGAAYVFVRSNGTWSQEAKLTPSDVGAGASFGFGMGLDGERAIVAAELADTVHGSDAGAVYVFNGSGGSWSQEAKLTPSDGAAGDEFGTPALEGSTVIAGSERADTVHGSDAGAAYVFEESGGSWSQQAKLTPSDGAADDRFGFGLSLDGPRVLITAPLSDAKATDAGAAYVFEESGGSWNQQAQLLASDGAEDDIFGVSASLDGDEALIGAYYDDNANGQDAGSAYRFDRTGPGTWAQQAKLTASDGSSGDLLGLGTSLDGGTALVSAPEDRNDNGFDAGAAYTFWAPPAPANVTASPGPPLDAITVAWDRPAGAERSLIYHVYRATSPGGPFEEVATTTNRSYRETELTNRTYRYRVTASHDADTVPSDPSPVVASKPKAPAPPTARATASDQPAEIQLEWPAADTDASLTYHVLRSSNGGPYTEIAETDGRSYTDTGLGDAMYRYRVTATSPGGMVSDAAQVGAHPRPPAPPSLAAAQGDAGEVALDWEPPGAAWDPDAYRVFRGTQAGGPYRLVEETSGTTYTDSGLTADTYHYVVTAVDDGVESPPSEEADASSGFDPRVPTDPDEAAQNDAGTGGDASDDTDDPTVLAGGVVIRINGTLHPTTDPVDVYGTRISPNATVSMRFHFHSPATMGLNVTLLDPDGNEHDADVAPLEGGDVIVEAEADAGEHLQEGVWRTVLEHGLRQDAPEASPAAPTPAAGPSEQSSPTGPASHGPVDAPVDTHVNATDDGVVPDIVPNRFTVIDYRDKRPCSPRC